VRIEYQISDDEARRAKEFFEEWAKHGFVIARRRRNVEGLHEPPNRAEFWEALASALLTTQQRSGPNAPITRLISTVPFPLSLSACEGSAALPIFVEDVIRSFGGIRRGPTIGSELQSNISHLQGGGWSPLLDQLRNLEAGATVVQERCAARYLAANLKGIGPKQARNVLQMLGLTRYETPIDSRVTKWLQRFGFPIPLSAAILSDPGYYEFVEDGLQEICRAAGVLPCMMDAAIFASHDRVDYGEEVMRW
jgi:hypothetical protein